MFRASLLTAAAGLAFAAVAYFTQMPPTLSGLLGAVVGVGAMAFGLNRWD